MTSDASAPQSRSATRPPPWRAWARRAVGLLLIGMLAAIGIWNTTKPLPPGTHVSTPWVPTPTDQVRLLTDTTTADGFGRRILEQQIFDELLRVVRDAREFIVLDMFLFNDQRGALAQAADTPGTLALRPLTRELRDALIDATRRNPRVRVLVISDPINDVYGGEPSADFAMLRAAGAEVVRTDLDQLRDSNPLYSSIWRLAIRWWSGDGEGSGWLPNPLESGPSRVTFRAWARLLNFKANHRKTLIADDGRGGLIGIVGSANAHDASGAHSNVALELRGPALVPLLRSELEIARFSGGNVDDAVPPGLVERAAAPPAGAGPQVFVRTLTEGGLLEGVLERMGSTRAGDRIDCAMFYLSDRQVLERLIAAATRGVEVRLILDPNRDAFGRQKGGIPNRPVASELVSRSDGAIKVRWFRTRGEQFHTKLLLIRSSDRIWLTTGSANFTRRNLRDLNLEANLAVEAPLDAPIAVEAARYFETLWSNRAPVGVEYTADFGAYADPAQTSYWVYRLLEATGFSMF
jgi:phosphatidylserine/phosphatidylglycerophosphate/cardiolipin synthase-like enzyme